MAKSIKLDLKSNFEFVLIGLVTSEPIYRLSWLINQALNTQLADFKPVQLLHKQSKIVQPFTRFAYRTVDDTVYELIQNRGLNGVLIEEQRNIDFFLKITGFLSDRDELFERLKGIKNVSLAIVIEPGSLKSKDRLISYGEDF